MDNLFRLNISEISKNDILKLYAYDVDWTQEPKESIKELCKQHAQLIRDSYDYVILYFSGGSDSTTILNAFLDNNIPIDEIITTTFDQVDIPCFDGIYAQNYLKMKGYTGIFTNPRISLDKLTTFMKSDTTLSEAKNYTGTINSLTRLSIDKLEQYDFAVRRKRLGNVAHIYGFEHPKVLNINNHYYVVHTVGRELIIRCNHNDKAINFFSSKTFPKLYVKQAHMIAKLMKRLGVNSLSTEYINKLIRDTHNPLISPPKSNGSNFIKSKTQSEAWMIYNSFSKDSAFKDLYLNSVLSQQYKIENAISKLSMDTMKCDLLF